MSLNTSFITLLLSSTLFTGSCGIEPFGVNRTAQSDQVSMKIDKQMMNMARSTKYRYFTTPDFVGNAQVDYIRLVDELHQHGYTTTVKGVNAAYPDMATTNVITRTIRLPHDWGARPLERKTALLAHELVHVRQAKDMGRALFVLRYAKPSWRWALEIQAYAEMIAVQQRLGLSVRTAQEVAASLIKNYRPWSLFNKKAAENEILRATLEVLGG